MPAVAQQARAAARALAHAVLSAVAAQPPLHLNCAPRVQAMLLICAAAGARDDRGGCNYDGASALPQLDATRGVVTMLPQLSRSSVWPPQALKAATQCSTVEGKSSVRLSSVRLGSVRSFALSLSLCLSLSFHALTSFYHTPQH